MLSLPPQHTGHDEDYINKSLLASLDDDADNEPIHDSAVPTSYNSTSNSSSSGSPSVNYPVTAHNNQQIIQQQRSDSPHHHSDNHGDQNSIYNLHSFYQNPSSIHSHPEFNSEYDTLKFPQPSAKLNGFIQTTSTKHSFNSYPNTTRSRHQANAAPAASYRDPQAFYPTSSSDLFSLQMSSPNHIHMQPFDPRASYDYNTGHPLNGAAHKAYLSDHYSAPPAAHPKPPFQQQQSYPSTQPQFTNGIHLSSQTPYGPHVPTSVPGSTPSNQGAPSGLISSNITNGSNTTINGEEISTIFVVGFPEDMQEREFQNMFTFSPGFEAATLKIPNKEFTSYGGLIGAAPSSAVTPAVGVGANGLRGAFHYAGLNDPYNMVTVNQGGVVVDGGRDGGMASWPAAAPLNVNDDLTGPHYLGPGINIGMSGGLNAGGALGSGANLPPRKQIIGFAKFRSREEALAARDVLQGRRVDIEKGAVLKAEMAKKNLHTKRGVGPIPGVGGSGAQQGQGQQQQQQTNGLDPFDSYREREHSGSSLPSTSLAHLSRLGWRDPVVALTQQQQETTLLNGSTAEEERKRDMVAMALAMGLPSTNTNSSPSGSSTATGTIAMRGARERAEDDERERRRKEKEMKEKELNLMRLRASNSAAYDAFHGIPISRQSSSGVGAGGSVNGAQSESVAGSSPLLAEADTHLDHQQQQYQYDEVVGPWDRINSMSATTVGRPRSASQCSSSPPPIEGNLHHESESEREYAEYHLHIQQQVQQQREESPNGYMSNENGSVLDGSSGDRGVNGTTLHDDPIPRSELVLNTSGLHPLQRIGQYQHHPQALQHQQQQLHDLAGTGAGNGGSQTSGSGGNTSPQLPSPTSGGSTTSATSASLRGTVDQNPPINTLYVGNLPTSPPPNGFPQDYLEDTLREIFSARPGYRKLCFRQKSNGPMCFVEFEDVQHATRAITELSGNTLRGAVKNGIRLSYSKNPLGVRTPTSAGCNVGGPTLQQQQQLVQTLHNHHHNHNQQFGSDGALGHPRVDDYTSHRVQQQTQTQPAISRRDTTSSTSSLTQGQLQSFVGGSNSSHNSFLSSPPPRFYSASPGSGVAYGLPATTTTTTAAAAPTSSSTLSGASSAFIPRANGGMFGGGGQSHGHIGSNASWLASPSSFSPFGMALAGESYQSHMIPGDHHQHQQQQHQQHQHQHPQSGPAAIDH